MLGATTREVWRLALAPDVRQERPSRVREEVIKSARLLVVEPAALEKTLVSQQLGDIQDVFFTHPEVVSEDTAVNSKQPALPGNPRRPRGEVTSG
jgi:hypothetical protein